MQEFSPKKVSKNSLDKEIDGLVRSFERNFKKNNLQKVNLDTISKATNFSKFHFHRSFKKNTDETIQFFQRRLKLENAAFAVRNSNLKLHDIAFENGFDSYEGFCRSFKKYFNCSPREYKKNFLQQTSSSLVSPREIISISTKLLPKIEYAFERKLGDYQEYPGPFAKNETWLAFLEKFGWEKQETLMGICHDDPTITPISKLRYDLCIIRKENVSQKNSNVLQTGAISKGRYLLIEFFGEFSKINEAYRYILDGYIQKNSKWKDRISEKPPFEIFKTPLQNQEVKTRVDIYFPIKN